MNQNDSMGEKLNGRWKVTWLHKSNLYSTSRQAKVTNQNRLRSALSIQKLIKKSWSELTVFCTITEDDSRIEKTKIPGSLPPCSHLGAWDSWLLL